MLDSHYLWDRDKDMLPMNRASLSLTIAVFAMIECISFALAQQPSTAPANSDWRVECTNNGKVLDCRAFVEVIQRDNHEIITSVALRYPAETKNPVMLVQVPLGVLVTDPIAISDS